MKYWTSRLAGGILMLETFESPFIRNPGWKIDFEFDCSLRDRYKTLIKTKEYASAKKLLMARIDEGFLDKSGAYYAYGPQTFTTSFFGELLKLLVKLDEREELLAVFWRGMRLPHIKRENEIYFSLCVQNLYPEMAAEHMPKVKETTINRKIVSKKGKQIFLGENGTELFVEEVALEFYCTGTKWQGIWMNPSDEHLYFKHIQDTIGQEKYNELISSVMWRMGHKCNRWYGAPDLFLYTAVPKKAGKSVEVKGPKDDMSAAQLVWLEQFDRFGVDCEVLHVKDELGS